ncbi:MAG: hypothetical protein AB7K71_02485 [Polyangiaceae bacterium]
MRAAEDGVELWFEVVMALGSWRPPGLFSGVQPEIELEIALALTPASQLRRLNKGKLGIRERRT